MFSHGRDAGNRSGKARDDRGSRCSFRLDPRWRIYPTGLGKGRNSEKTEICPDECSSGHPLDVTWLILSRPDGLSMVLILLRGRKAAARLDSLSAQISKRTNARI